MSIFEEIRRSRSAQIGVLTRLNNEIKTLIANEEEIEKLIEKRTSYENAWKRFVDSHEEYFILLNNEHDKEAARQSYLEQIERKLTLESLIKEQFNKRNVEVACSSKVSEQSSKSSKSSSISRKREKLALMRLRLKQLEKIRELELEEFEIQRKHEFEQFQIQRRRKYIEAKMKEEEAETCPRVYEYKLDIAPSIK